MLTGVPALPHQAGTDGVVSPHMGLAQHRGTLQSSDHSCAVFWSVEAQM